ncbi:hypothetical protein [Anabaena azotica]|uniref:Uncharacterized protein n=1 Tax=Anabaena azotica FACHB-119 TaxID=947527 RepID=A0ABR8DF91_9NOST|nr:hypothetical protein [Anabaena azotica]MBD2505055.1 hypothetical protein [Anabaena azotica FACHB-119]
MNITSKMAMSIGVHFLFQMHRHEIPEDTRLYLELAQDLRFLVDWEIEGEQLVLTFYEGTQKSLDVRAYSTFEYLKEQVEFFYRAILGI